MDLPLTASSPIFIHIFGLTSDCHLFKFLFFHLDLHLIASSFHFSSGPTSDCQFFKFLFFHLDLPLIANSSNFYHFFISGLTSDCQFFKFLFFLLDWPLIASSFHPFFLLTCTYLRVPVWFALWLCHTCLPDWTYTFDARLVGIRNSLKILNLTKFPSSFWRCFWSFYRVQNPFFCPYFR